MPQISLETCPAHNDHIPMEKGELSNTIRTATVTAHNKITVHIATAISVKRIRKNRKTRTTRHLIVLVERKPRILANVKVHMALAETTWIVPKALSTLRRIRKALLHKPGHPGKGAKIVVAASKIIRLVAIRALETPNSLPKPRHRARNLKARRKGSFNIRDTRVKATTDIVKIAASTKIHRKGIKGGRRMNKAAASRTNKERRHLKRGALAAKPSAVVRSA
tara:strand:- start:742 stop:1407 length:666 start_codon:yes stop_codon:yes gene_type:complete